MSSKERNSIEVGWKPLFHWWLTINYVFFAFITQPLLYIQTVEAVRNNRFGPPRHDEPHFDSPAYRRARRFFQSNRANDSNTMAIEPPNQNNDDILLIGGPPRHQVLDQQAFFANARPQQPPYFEIMNFPPTFHSHNIPPIFQGTRYENSPYFQIVNSPPNFHSHKIPHIFQETRYDNSP